MSESRKWHVVPTLRSLWRRTAPPTVAAVVAAGLVVSGGNAATVAQAAEPPRAAPGPANDDAQEAPTRGEAARLAAKYGHRVEVTGLRDDSSTTWVLPDGRMQSELYTGPIRTKRNDRWVDVDTSLTRDGDIVRPRAGAADVALSAGGAARPLASVQGGGRSFSMLWPGTLPAPQLSGDVATYRDVKPGMDVTVTSKRTGFSQAVVLSKRPTEPLVIRLPLRLKGLRATQDADGTIRLTDARGKRVGTATAAHMWGAETEPHSAEPVHHKAVPTKLVQTPSGPEIVLTPDPTFLADPAVKYPLTIDPDGELSVNTDTWVDSSYSSPQRTSTMLRAGRYDSTNSAKSLLKFNLGLIDGTDVSSATMKLYEWHSWSCTPSDMYVHRITTDWDPDTATWTNQPSYASTASATVSAAKGWSSTSCPAGWVSVPLTSLFQAWANGTYPNYGLRLSGDESTNNGWKKFYSANQGGNVVPYVDVVYGAVPEAPQDVEASSGNNSATVTWAAPASNGGSSITGYTVRRFTIDSNGTVISTGTATVGSTVRSYTSTSVANGDRLYFEVSATNANGTGPAARSNTVIVGTPTQPTRVDAVPGEGAAGILWSPPSSNGGASVTSYNVKRVITGGSTGQVSVTPVSGQTEYIYTSAAPQNGDEVTMSVQACNSRGCGEWVNARKVIAIDSLGLAGDRGYFSYDSRSLTDKLRVKVNLSTGNLMAQMSHMTLPGATRDVTIGHTYNSLSQYQGTAAAGAPGRGWRLSTGSDLRLAVQGDGSVIFHGTSGGTEYFKKNADGSFTGPKSAKADLTGGGTGDSVYKLTTHGSGEILRFNSSGILTSHAERTDRTDTRVTLTNPNANGYPQTVTGSRGPSGPKSVTLGYNTAGTRVSTITQNGTDNQSRSASFSIDANDDLRSVTDMNGKVTYFDYDADHNLTKITTPEGRVTTFTYDLANRVTKMTRDPGGADEAVTTYDWRSAASRLLLVDARGNTTRYAFDKYDLITAVRDPAGHLQSKTYTPYNDVATFASSVAGTTTNEYNANSGESLSKSTGPSGAAGTISYNQSSSLTKYLPSSATNPAGDQSTYTYDGPGNLTGSTDVGGAEAYVERNDDGTVHFTTDPEQKGKTHSPASDCTRDNNTVDNCWAYKYDNSDKNLTRILPPNNAGTMGTRTYAYDRYNRMNSVSVGGGSVVSTFDKMDRLVDRDYSDLRTSVTYTYDDDGNVEQRTDETGVTLFEYDKLGRLKKKTLPGPHVLTYTYDDNGNLLTLTDGRGTTSYTYEKRNKLVQITESTGRLTLFGYDHDGRRTDTYYNTSGTNGDYAHLDSEGDLLKPAGFTAHVRSEFEKGDLVKVVTTRRSEDTDPARVSDFSYSYEQVVGGVTKNVGRRTKMTDNITGVETSYSYSSGRLTGANATSGTDYYYCYDKNGNRKWEGGTAPSSCGSVTPTHTFNDANQQTDVGWSHDAAGNATAVPGVGIIGYDGLDFTTSVTPSGQLPTTFTYAGTDQNERVTAGTATFGNGLTGVQSRTSGTPAQTVYFERDPDGQLVSMVVGTNEYYYAFDGLGSVTALIDASNGNIVGTYSYDPYGNHTVGAGEAPNTAIADSNPWRYAGGYYDSASKLTKFGLRYYASAHGRFTQRDPVTTLANPAKANSYAYVGGNPVNHIDPSGADWGDEFQTIAAVVVGSAVTAVVGGLVCGTSGGVLCGVAAGMAGGYVGGVIDAIGEDDPQVVMEKVLRGTLYGALAGGIGGGIASFFA